MAVLQNKLAPAPSPYNSPSKSKVQSEHSIKTEDNLWVIKEQLSENGLLKQNSKVKTKMGPPYICSSFIAQTEHSCGWLKYA